MNFAQHGKSPISGWVIQTAALGESRLPRRALKTTCYRNPPFKGQNGPADSVLQPMDAEVVKNPAADAVAHPLRTNVVA